MNKTPTLPTQKSAVEDFKLVRSTYLKEIQATLNIYEHTKLKSTVINIANDDPENVFCLFLPTRPDSSNGVAHILEHTVLCGSEKYPVSDPFFSMNRRSLNTFMNAFTSSDFTCYPAASQIPADLRNLLSVYIDAVFFPHLNKLSFLQEGHRLDLSENDELSIKGIVYNEMKGAMSSPQGRLWYSLYEALFPDVTYGVNYGGEPKVIPELTFEEFKKFHETFYHPSRCLFFFYGDTPIEENLSYLNEELFSRYQSAAPALKPIESQKRFNKPFNVAKPYPASSEEDLSERYFYTLGWVTCDIQDQDDLLALTLVDSILMDTDASPLRKKILESKLAKTASSHLENDIKDIPYAINLSGCKKDLEEEITTFIISSLKDIAETGLDKDLIQTALHQLEIQKLEINSEPYPYGLSLAFRTLPIYQHEGSVDDSLQIYSLFERIEQKLESTPDYLEQIMTKYLVDNPHRITLTLYPDPDLEAKEKEDEEEHVKSIDQTLNTEDRNLIKKTSEELEERQEKEDDPNILPQLQINEIPTQPTDFPLAFVNKGSNNFFSHDVFTNHLTYIDLFAPVNSYQYESLHMLHLFSLFSSQLGAGSKSYDQQLQHIQRYTGGLIPHITPIINCFTNEFKLCYQMHCQSLDRNINEAIEIMKESFYETRLDEDARIENLLQKHVTSLQNALPSNAIKYAMSVATRAIDPIAALIDSLQGFNYFEKVRSQATSWSQDSSSLLKQLSRTQNVITNPSQLDFIIAGQSQNFASIQDQIHSQFDQPLSSVEAHKDTLEKQNHSHQIYTLPMPISFSCYALKAPTLADSSCPLITLACRIMENKVLHKRIREQGGAYGSGISYKLSRGTLCFYSYRDPNLLSTYKAFKEALETVATKSISLDEINEAKREMIQQLDQPVTPGNRAETAYLYNQKGMTLDQRQLFRNQILNANQDQIQQAVQEHLVSAFEEGVFASFSGSELITKEHKALEQEINSTITINKL